MMDAIIKNGIRPSQDLVLVVRNSPAPQNIADVLKFLVFINKFVKYIPGLLSTTVLLRLLIRH